jgi:hypothetical protein
VDRRLSPKCLAPADIVLLAAHFQRRSLEAGVWLAVAVAVLLEEAPMRLPFGGDTVFACAPANWHLNTASPFLVQPPKCSIFPDLAYNI